MSKSKMIEALKASTKKQFFEILEGDDFITSETKKLPLDELKKMISEQTEESPLTSEQLLVFLGENPNLGENSGDVWVSSAIAKSEIYKKISEFKKKERYTVFNLKEFQFRISKAALETGFFSEGFKEVGGRNPAFVFAGTKSQLEDLIDPETGTFKTIEIEGIEKSPIYKLPIVTNSLYRGGLVPFAGMGITFPIVDGLVSTESEKMTVIESDNTYTDRNGKQINSLEFRNF